MKNLIGELPFFRLREVADDVPDQEEIFDSVKALVRSLRDTNFDFGINNETCTLAVRANVLHSSEAEDILRMMHWTRTMFVIGNHYVQPVITSISFYVEIFAGRDVLFTETEFSGKHQFYTADGQITDSIRVSIEPDAEMNQIVLNCLNPDDAEIDFDEADENIPCLYISPHRISEVNFSFERKRLCL